MGAKFRLFHDPSFVAIETDDGRERIRAKKYPANEARYLWLRNIQLLANALGCEIIHLIMARDGR
jgi:hypothetical protein